MRTFVYVDGFNLYYGALKGTPHRWLDIKALVEKLLLPGHEIIKIKVERAAEGEEIVISRTPEAAWTLCGPRSVTGWRRCGVRWTICGPGWRRESRT